MNTICSNPDCFACRRLPIPLSRAAHANPRISLGILVAIMLGMALAVGLVMSGCGSVTPDAARLNVGSGGAGGMAEATGGQAGGSEATGGVSGSICGQTPDAGGGVPAGGAGGAATTAAGAGGAVGTGGSNVTQ